MTYFLEKFKPILTSRELVVLALRHSNISKDPLLEVDLDNPTLSFQEVADIVDMTRERVKQIESKAIYKIKEFTSKQFTHAKSKIQI